MWTSSNLIKAFNSTHIFLYKGYGGHIGYSKGRPDDYENSTHYYRRPSYPLAGIDGILGLEYRLYKYPFTAGFEFKPFAELGGRRIFRLNLWDFGVVLKYTFSK